MGDAVRVSALPILQHASQPIILATQAVAGANNDPATLMASVSHLNAAVQAGIDAHRPLFQDARAGKGLSLAQLEGLSAMFDSLQYNAIGLRVQASSLLARTQGQPSPVCEVPLGRTVNRVLDDLRAFSVEKFGVAPPVEVSVCPVTLTGRPGVPPALYKSGGPDVTMLGLPEFVAFCVTELIKNSYRAHIDHYGAAGVDDAPPVSVRVSGDRRYASVRVSDTGGGGNWGPGPLPRWSYFSSTFQQIEAGWAYSRTHGTPFTGLGLGLVRADLHARFMGGGLRLSSQPGGGCDALLVFDRTGEGAHDFVPMPPSR